MGITPEGLALVRLDLQKWGQSLADLRRLALHAPHPRTRERFLALSLIADGTHNATTWATRFGRQDDTVLCWVHRYNREGPEGLTYPRTGSRPPFSRPTRPSGSSRSPATPSRSTTACPATDGP
jgi:Homeodomain-like domain